MKNFKIIILLTISIIFLFLSNQTFSQVQLDWVKRYSGIGSLSDGGFGICTDKSGNVYVTGSVQISSGYLCTTIKYDKFGDSMWVRKYERPGNTYNQGYDIKVDDSSSVYIAGSAFILKYNKYGILIWTKYESASFYKIILDSDGNIYAGGLEGGHFVVVKYDKYGNQLWIRNDQRSYSLSDMVLDKNGNVIITGESEYISTSYDYKTIKYSNAGALLWVRSYNGLAPQPSYDLPYGLAVDNQCNVYVTGASQDAISVFNNVTIKYDSLGNEIWIKRLYPPSNGHGIAVDEFQNVYVSSRSNGNNYTRKLDIDGNILWTKTYPTTSSFATNRRILILDSANNVYVTANIDSNNYTRYGVIKYDSNGNQIFLASYGFISVGVNYVIDMDIDKKGSVYLTGTSQGSGTGYDFATVKYSEIPTGILENNIQLNQFKLEQNYPNPFNPSTTISFSLPEYGFVKLKIFDMLGKEIKTLVNEFKNAGNYFVDFNGSDLSSGVYYYKLITGDFVTTKKMLLIK